MFIDEYWACQNARMVLENQLLDVPGVPDTQYFVRDAKVYVFQLLVQQVSDRGLIPKESPEQIIELIESSFVDPIEAIRVWNIAPDGFSIAEEGPLFHIQHDKLDARIQENYLQKATAELALAKVLISQTLVAEGDFMFDNQWMVLNAPLDMGLPLKPAFSTHALYTSLCDYHTSNPFVECEDLVSRDFHRSVASLVTDWEAERFAIKTIAVDEYPLIWHQIAGKALAPAANEIDLADPANAREATEASKLLSYYPELSAMGLQGLHDHFLDFSNPSYFRSDIMAERNEDFSCYLLGRLVNPNPDREQSLALGKYAWFALKRGDTWQQACEFSNACQVYNDALEVLSERLGSVMRVFYKARQSERLVESLQDRFPDATSAGRPPQNFARLIVSEGRKIGTISVQAYQSTADFSNDIVVAL